MSWLHGNEFLAISISQKNETLIEIRREANKPVSFRLFLVTPSYVAMIVSYDELLSLSHGTDPSGVGNTPDCFCAVLVCSILEYE